MKRTAELLSVFQLLLTSIVSNELVAAQVNDDSPSIIVIRGESADWWGYWMHKDDNAAAALKDKFQRAWERASSDERAYRDGEDPSAYNRRMDLSQAEFLCEWKEAHASGNPSPLSICGTALAQQVAEARRASKLSAAQVATKRETRFNQTVGQLSPADLCSSYSSKKYQAARTELKRRNSLSEQEWALIDRHEMQVGMSEVALICAVGLPTRVHSTTTADGTRKQYVYSGGYVYVMDGVVTGIQD